MPFLRHAAKEEAAKKKFGKKNGHAEKNSIISDGCLAALWLRGGAGRQIRSAVRSKAGWVLLAIEQLQIFEERFYR